MQSQIDHNYVRSSSPQEERSSQARFPAEVDKLLSKAIAQALAPLQESINKLSA